MQVPDGVPTGINSETRVEYDWLAAVTLQTKAFPSQVNGGGPEEAVSSANTPAMATATMSKATFMISDGFPVVKESYE